MKIIDIYKNYFWPIDNFKNCSVGNKIQKMIAIDFNQKNADLLIVPILNWLNFVLMNFLILYFVESFFSQNIIALTTIVISAILMVWGVVGFIILLIAFIFLKGGVTYS